MGCIFVRRSSFTFTCRIFGKKRITVLHGVLVRCRFGCVCLAFWFASYVQKALTCCPNYSPHYYMRGIGGSVEMRLVMCKVYNMTGIVANWLALIIYCVQILQSFDTRVCLRSSLAESLILLLSIQHWYVTVSAWHKSTVFMHFSCTLAFIFFDLRVFPD